SFGKLTGSRLHFLEQPRVLDGDDGLVGEGFEQFDLSVGKRAYLGAPDRNHPNCFTSTDQRLMQHGADTQTAANGAALRVLSGFGLYISDMDRSAVEDGTCGGNTTYQGQRVIDREGADPPMLGDEAQTIAKHLKDHGVIRIAQACRGLDQRIEYFLHVEGRPADDLQNIGSGCLLFQAFC